MPIAYPYLRVSHQDSARSGLSPETQLARCHQYFELRGLVEQGVRFYDDELLYDPAVSARHVPFLDRKMGRKLQRMLQPGDHVIFAHLDRASRPSWTSPG